MRAIHPGEILREEYFVSTEDGVSAVERVLKFLKNSHISANTLQSLVKEEIPINSWIAKNLAEYFNTTEDFWLNMQKNYDQKVYEQRKNDDKRKADQINTETTLILYLLDAIQASPKKLKSLMKIVFDSKTVKAGVSDRINKYIKELEESSDILKTVSKIRNELK